jgi:hypothetical protein
MGQERISLAAFRRWLAASSWDASDNVIGIYYVGYALK